MFKKITRDVENPTREQDGYFARAKRILAALPSVPLPIETVDLYKIRIERQIRLAGRVLTKELGDKITRAAKASHNRNILKNFECLKDGLPRRLAELVGDDIRRQMGHAAGGVVKPNSAFDIVVSRAVENSVARDAARERDTVRIRALAPGEP